ncbi:hypothetical protein QYF61_002140 [Mycteria americana]|uniref:Uncharacterized protein n=1 Tax=Mycteria americana TaxID=33587 RepID=A0AAN7S275_MYCAM|nr:hypothetical protein QYF61_002140 [Mycteria americana]
MGPRASGGGQLQGSVIPCVPPPAPGESWEKRNKRKVTTVYRKVTRKVENPPFLGVWFNLRL